MGRGISKTISMSNTIKITAKRKNRVENGSRAVFLGSNPHSNGDAFSRSFVDRVLIRSVIINTAVGMIIARRIANVIIIIHLK